MLQTGFGSGFLPLGSGLESDSKNLESEHLCLFANLGDLDEILQLGISDWHSTFCKS